MMFTNLVLTCILSFLDLAFAAPNVSSALHCISTSAPNLPVITPSNPDYVAVSQPFNLRFSPSPAIVVLPTLVKQVQAVVACAGRSGLSVSAKSGGHSYAAYGLSGDVVVDLRYLKGLKVYQDGRAVVQTGNDLGDLATGIFNQAGRALPHGTCPYIGTGGHTLYGGYGFFGRSAGLLLDRVVSAEVVLADGSLVTASNTSHPDLFWAIRGGGPSFGLVTAWTYDTLPAPPTQVHYDITPGVLPVDQVVAAYTAWQTFVNNPTLPWQLSTLAHFGSAKTQGWAFIGFSGIFYGPEEEFQRVMAPLMAQLPAATTVKTSVVDWITGLEQTGGSLNTTPPDGNNTFFAKSLITTGPSSQASIVSFVNFLATEGVTTDAPWFVLADLWGGAISAVPDDATAFANRDAFLVFQFYASSPNGKPPYPQDGVAFVDAMVTSLEPKPRGAYPNYMDPTLTRREWESMYFGRNVQRLKKVKDAVDPGNVFRFAEGFTASGDNEDE